MLTYFFDSLCKDHFFCLLLSQKELVFCATTTNNGNTYLSLASFPLYLLFSYLFNKC